MAQVCRICLITDVKMFNLSSHPLCTYFGTIIGAHPSSIIEAPVIPPYACYECVTHIQKYYNFRSKCIKGQTALYDIITAKGMITTDNVKQIDREALKLTSNLTVVHGEYLTLLANEVIVDIKEEPSTVLANEDCSGVEVDFVKDVDSGSLSSSDDNESLILYKTEHKRRNRKKKLKEEVLELPGLVKAPIKEEDLPENELLLQVFNTEQNSVLKNKHSRPRKFVQTPAKLRSNSRKSKNPNKIDEQVIDNFCTVVELSEPKSEHDLPVRQPILQVFNTEEHNEIKKKRGRPRKCGQGPPKPRPSRKKPPSLDKIDGENIEDFCTVIKLSLEEQIAEVNNRKTSSNYQNAVYKCHLCYKGFIDTHAWQNHTAKHDPSAGDVECTICKLRFKNKRQLQKHVWNHEKKYACKSCTHVSRTSAQAKEHQRRHKGYTYQCQYCDEVSTKSTSHLSHMRLKHPSQFVCSICGYSFVSQRGLDMHKAFTHKDMVNKREEETGPYCGECDVKFQSEEAFKRHMVTSSKHMQNKDRNGCRVCGEMFNTLHLLKLHHRQEHPKKVPKNYGKIPSDIKWPTKCEHCSEKILNSRDYYAHLRRAHPNEHYPIKKNYVCDICGKGFRCNALLGYHRRTHSEVRAYKCATCGKAFHNYIYLHKHMKIHSELRPYPCDVCCKAFKCKAALDRHYRCHTGEKPYECEVCGKSFGQSNSRKLHVRTVHLKQPAPVSKSKFLKKNKVKEDIEIIRTVLRK
ncbi:hypothetical protein K1T71_009443 [Dendrolimus kikuchii]|uniref:Uncharacterized protein n=1 Tax=Dendrolimus kikuchii TaxID=765133 RepID=A0ACC1CVJ9_9NEOP|nr:hypothetical protein K1T71_009443 [Dendrolimus kikuchii]